jgi:hypothetical protein
MANHIWNGNTHDSSQKMIVIIAWIYLDFILSKSFQKKNYLMRHIRSNIFCNKFLNCLRNLFEIVSSFMQTMSVPIQPGSLKILWTKSLRIALNQTYSPDLVQSYFVLFEYIKYIKSCLRRDSYPSENALLDVIHTIFKNFFEGNVQRLDGKTDLSLRTQMLLLSIK